MHKQQFFRNACPLPTLICTKLFGCRNDQNVGACCCHKSFCTVTFLAFLRTTEGCVSGFNAFCALPCGNSLFQRFHKLRFLSMQFQFKTLALPAQKLNEVANTDNHSRLATHHHIKVSGGSVLGVHVKAHTALAKCAHVTETPVTTKTLRDGHG